MPEDEVDLRIPTWQEYLEHAHGCLDAAEIALVIYPEDEDVQQRHDYWANKVLVCRKGITNNGADAEVPDVFIGTISFTPVMPAEFIELNITVGA